MKFVRGVLHKKKKIISQASVSVVKIISINYIKA